jgi:hypothetical protein
MRWQPRGIIRRIVPEVVVASYRRSVTETEPTAAQFAIRPGDRVAVSMPGRDADAVVLSVDGFVARVRFLTSCAAGATGAVALWRLRKA